MKGEMLKLIFCGLTAPAQRRGANECAPPPLTPLLLLLLLLLLLPYHFHCGLYSQISGNINYYKYLITMNEQPRDI